MPNERGLEERRLNERQLAHQLGAVSWWLDAYFKLFGRQVLLASLTVGIMTYVVGLVTAWTIGFVHGYATTRQLYLGLIGIVWTGAYVGWGRRRISELLVEISPSFRPSAEQYAEAASRWLQRLLAWRPQVVVSLMLIMTSSAYIWTATRTSELAWFPPSWSSHDPDLWVRNIILCVYAIPILVLLTSALVFIAVFTLFVLSLRKLEVIPVLPAALAMLRPLAEFGLALSIGWSGGVSLFILFFRPRPAIGPIFLVAVLSVVAFTILFAPQYAIHRTLSRTKRSILGATAFELAGDLGPGKKDLSAFVSRLAVPPNQEIAKVVESISLSRTWVYSYSALIPLITPVGLPVAVFALRAILGQ